jgi:hypothetical protein
MSNKYTYQHLALDKYKNVYYNAAPQPVMSMQDPYNPWSYKTTIANKCSVPSNKRALILENYTHSHSMDDPYNEFSYSKPKC